MSFISNDDDKYINNVDNNFNDNVVDDSSDSLKIQDKRARCYIFEEVKRDIFLTWWITIKWALFHTNQNDNKKNKRLYWDNEKKTSVWEHFSKAAILENDTSKIVCKRCHFVLDHSFVNHDINTIKSHLSSKQCFETSKASDFFQLTLIKIWKRVSLFLFKFVVKTRDYYKD